MMIARSKLTHILEQLEVHGASGWELSKLIARVNSEGGIKRYADPPDRRPADLELAVVYDQLVADQEAGNLIEVVDDVTELPETTRAGTNGTDGSGAAVAVAKPKPRPSAGKPKSSRKQHAGVSKMGWDERKAYYASNPYPIPEDGVLATLVAELKKAGSSDPPKPITKAKLLDVLKKKHDDRRAESMELTINNHVPGRLRYKYGVHVWKQKLDDNKTGYYIVGEGKKPQPGQSAKSTAKPKPKPKKSTKSTNGKPPTVKRKPTAKPKPAPKKPNKPKPSRAGK